METWKQTYCGKFDQSCHFIGRLIPHVSLQISWILHKLNKETPFYGTL